jgi:hypothetical protein
MELTAVEWLVNELENHHIKIDIKNTVVYQQAKAMEKEQIIDAYRDGRSDQQSDRPSKFYNRMAEQYYNETFKK